MTYLRTPEERFTNLPGYPFEAHYTEIDGLRMHYVDEGAREAAPILLLHGEPSWSYLYRHMIPILAEAGYRVLAPDLIGFGKSDKLKERSDYTYQRHVDWMSAWLIERDIQDITLVCQDWGSLIGLRLVAQHPALFARVVLSNGGLPTGDYPMGKAFQRWKKLALNAPELPIGMIINSGCTTELAEDIIAAYDAPFPDETYKAGARIFPALVPNKPDDPASKANRQAWAILKQWNKPFLTAFSDQDPITHGAEQIFQEQILGAQGQPHTTIEGAGHFVQEDRGPELAQITLDFIKRTTERG